MTDARDSLCMWRTTTSRVFLVWGAPLRLISSPLTLSQFHRERMFYVHSIYYHSVTIAVLPACGQRASVNVQVPRSVFGPCIAPLDRYGREHWIGWTTPTCVNSDRDSCWPPQVDGMTIDGRPDEGCNNTTNSSILQSTFVVLIDDD